jgi:hypothetical protein
MGKRYTSRREKSRDDFPIAGLPVGSGMCRERTFPEAVRREHPGRIIFVIRITMSPIDTVKKNLYNGAAMHAVSVLKTHFARSMNT